MVVGEPRDDGEEGEVDIMTTETVCVCSVKQSVYMSY